MCGVIAVPSVNICASYSRHQELDTPQQLHPSAKSHLQVL